MKVLLVALNAKYVHTNLAVRYLEKKVRDICDAKIKEFSINDNLFSIEREIMLLKPSVVSFSAYIWNIEMILTLCSDIKKFDKNIKIILGGPEVSYDSKSLIKKHSFIDYIIKGEGEITFKNLIESIKNKTEILPYGITYKDGKNIIDTPSLPPLDFKDIDFPYEDDIDEIKGKIIYYESSRGCPYSCKYCLSGEKNNVRFKDVNQVKKDLEFFDSHSVGLVKFVDRTFNADKKRANEIFKHIGTLKGNTRFHMEITGELLNDETINILKTIDPSKLQFEIGVQSTNEKTLKAINRKCNKEKLFNNIKRLLLETKIHIHLDLIVGLIYEDFESFKNSFNEVFSLRPHALQIGFLKVLKGSKMQSECKKHNILYRDKAPYEIISNAYIGYEEILFLKDLEFVFDKVYNSGDFKKCIEFLVNKYNDAFCVFDYLTKYFKDNSLLVVSLSKPMLYKIVFDAFSHLGREFLDKIKYDYIKNLKPGKLPSWLGNDDFSSSEAIWEFLKDEEMKKEVMPKYYDVPAKEIIKHLRVEKFTDKILAFDYKNDLVYDVTKYLTTNETEIKND